MRYKDYQVTVTDNPIEANAITHAGTFHMDECMATVIIAKVCQCHVKVYRTTKGAEATDHPMCVVYDVGGGEFDHHMPGGNGARPNGVQYAACGLIWKKYGRTAVNRILKANSIESSTENVDWLWDYVDRELIQGIDANDTGTMPDREFPYNCLDISGIIRLMNVRWDYKPDITYLPDKSRTEERQVSIEDRMFLKAVKMAARIFDFVVDYAVSSLRAKTSVEKALNDALWRVTSRDENAITKSHIMILDSYLPWLDHIFNMGTDNLRALAERIIYVVYPAKRGGYQFRVVPMAKGSYDQRNHVPDSWLGLKDEELAAVCGVEDATFVHQNGFIGGAKTLDGAIAMACAAIDYGTINPDYAASTKHADTEDPHET